MCGKCIYIEKKERNHKIYNEEEHTIFVIPFTIFYSVVGVGFAYLIMLCCLHTCMYIYIYMYIWQTLHFMD